MPGVRGTPGAGRPPPRPGRRPPAPPPRAAPRAHAASTRSSPFFDGFAPYVTAATSRSRGGAADGSTGTGTITASACGRRRLGQPALAPRHEQRRGAHAAALDRPLPDPVAARAVAGGRGVEADRARARGEQRAAVVEEYSDRARAVLLDRRAAAARRADRAQASSISAIRPPLPRPLAPRHDGDRGARALAATPPSSSSASRSPAVPPSETSRTSAVSRLSAQERAAEAGRPHELDRAQRRGLVDVEAHARRAPRSPPPPTPAAATPAPR